jgi:flagella basal body P-ring formation protein FlgA
MNTKRKTKDSILLLVVLIVALLCAYSQGAASLRIYLPRQVEVERDTVTLGDIAVVRGDAESVAKAEAISIGKISTPSRQLVISKTMISGRLSSNGFDASDVEFTGAQKVEAGLSNVTIFTDDIVEVAESFIRKNLPDKSICGFEVVRRPGDFHLTDNVKKFELVPRSVTPVSHNTARVTISIFAGSEELASREVHFRLKYFRREAVALRNISAGEIITRDNVKVTEEISSENTPADWQVPYGKAAVRDIPAGNIVAPAMVGPVKREVIIKRNKRVEVVYKRPGLLLSSVGKALDDGKVGDYIRVKMQIRDSGRIINAKVQEDGTVEPLI